MRDKRERSLHNKRQLELERFGVRGVGRKGEKKNSRFPRGELGGKGKCCMLFFAPFFPSFFSFSFFLIFSFPHCSRRVLFPPRDGRKPRAISFCQRSLTPSSQKKTHPNNPKTLLRDFSPPRPHKHFQPRSHMEPLSKTLALCREPLRPGSSALPKLFPKTGGGDRGLSPSPPSGCFLPLSPPLLGVFFFFMLGAQLGSGLQHQWLLGVPPPFRNGVRGRSFSRAGLLGPPRVWGKRIAPGGCGWVGGLRLAPGGSGDGRDPRGSFSLRHPRSFLTRGAGAAAGTGSGARGGALPPPRGCGGGVGWCREAGLGERGAGGCGGGAGAAGGLPARFGR